MVVVDTNIVAHLVLEGDVTAGARALLAADTDWHSESFLLVELTNVMATAVRSGRMKTVAAESALMDGERIIATGLHAAPHADVLALALKYGVSGYDARFLAVAERLATKLVTEDAKLRKAAPALTQSLAQALAA
jgi:predicted nucleic acid-binding protein